MPTFHIPDMHCDGCVRSLTKAALSLDQAAILHADLAARTLHVTTAVSPQAMADAFEDAGFTVEPA